MQVQGRHDGFIPDIVDVTSKESLLRRTDSHALDGYDVKLP
jgi:hypothetical protein